MIAKPYATKVHIIRAKQNHHMHQRLAGQDRYYTPECDFVLCEQFFRAHVATADAKDDDYACENGTPPADQQRGLVFAEEAVRGGLAVQHCCDGKPRPGAVTSGRVLGW